MAIFWSWDLPPFSGHGFGVHFISLGSSLGDPSGGAFRIELWYKPGIPSDALGETYLSLFGEGQVDQYMVTDLVAFCCPWIWWPPGGP